MIFTLLISRVLSSPAVQSLSPGDSLTRALWLLRSSGGGAESWIFNKLQARPFVWAPRSEKQGTRTVVVELQWPSESPTGLLKFSGSKVGPPKLCS